MITLKPEVAEAKRGRDHVVEIAADWPVDLDDVRVVVSELVSNAIRHAWTDEIHVDAYSDRDEYEGMYVVEVWDADTDGPVMCRRPPVDAEGGRGLGVVMELADRVGTRFDREDDGKVVFAEWTVTF